MSDMGINDVKAFSRKLSSVLDNIGYSPPIVKDRREYYADIDHTYNLSQPRLIRFIAGSKCEGFSTYCEGDTDYLRIDRYVVCTISGKEEHIEKRDKVTVFQMLSDKCTPGHFILKRIKRGSYPLTNSVAEALLTPDKTESFISSDLYTNSLVQELSTQAQGGFVTTEKAGPAVPQNLGGIKTDHVFGFRCNCQKMILSEWISRPRKYNWPSLQLILEVTKLEAQIVPVGSKTSEYQDLEWRICFIPGEMTLTHSLSEDQYKIYLLLKLINKCIFKPVCSEISSYIMKNIVFWLVETHPKEIFTTDNLFDNTLVALAMFQQAIKDNCCPYYMIPKRNLLSGRLSAKDVEKLMAVLDTIRDEGPRAILRCNKLKDAWLIPTVELEIKGRKKDDVERALLQLQKFKSTFKFRPHSTWEEKDKQLYATVGYMEIVIKVRDLAWPEWREHYTTNEDMQKMMAERLGQILS